MKRTICITIALTCSSLAYAQMGDALKQMQKTVEQIEQGQKKSSQAQSSTSAPSSAPRSSTQTKDTSQVLKKDEYAYAEKGMTGGMTVVTFADGRVGVRVETANSSGNSCEFKGEGTLTSGKLVAANVQSKMSVDVYFSGNKARVDAPSEVNMEFCGPGAYFKGGYVQQSVAQQPASAPNAQQATSTGTLSLGSLTMRLEDGAGCFVFESAKSKKVMIGQLNEPKGDWFNINGKNVQLQNTASIPEQNKGIAKYQYQGTDIVVTSSKQVLQSGKGAVDVKIGAGSPMKLFAECGA